MGSQFRSRIWPHALHRPSHRQNDPRLSLQFLISLSSPAPGALQHLGGSYTAASTVEFRCAMASMEIIGFTPEAFGNDEPSITSRFLTSQVSPCGLVADEWAEPPMRAVPIMWNENSATCALPQPAASMSRANVTSEPRFAGSYVQSFAWGE